MPVSDRTYEEVFQSLLRVGYEEHVHETIDWGNILDMRGIALARDDWRSPPAQPVQPVPLHLLLYHFLTRPLHERLLVLSKLDLLEGVALKTGETDLDLMYYAFRRARDLGKSADLHAALVHLQRTCSRSEDRRYE
jgi:hypothetical protein